MLFIYIQTYLVVNRKGAVFTEVVEEVWEVGVCVSMCVLMGRGGFEKKIGVAWFMLSVGGCNDLRNVLPTEV